MSTYQPVSRKAGTGSASVFSRVFGRNRQDAKLPRIPQSKQIDQHNARQYAETETHNRSAARRELHSAYARKVAETLRRRDGLYLEHLASDWTTHWPRVPREPDDDGLADRPGKLRKRLQTGLFDLFRPRLEAFFDMELPMEEDKRDDGEDEVLSREKYAPIFADRLGRIAFIESATVAAWCRFQLEDLQHEIKLENVFLNGFWSVAQKCTTITGVVEKAGEYLERERRLDYLLLIEAEFRKRIGQPQQHFPVIRRLEQAKKVYKDIKQSCRQREDAEPDPASFRSTPDVEPLRTRDAERTRFWVAWVLSRPSLRRAQRCGPNWRKALGEFLEDAQAKQTRDAGPTVQLLEDYGALGPIARGGRKELRKIVHGPLAGHSIAHTNLDVPLDEENLARAVRNLTSQTAVPSSPTAS